MKRRPNLDLRQFADWTPDMGEAAWKRKLGAFEPSEEQKRVGKGPHTVSVEPGAFDPPFVWEVQNGDCDIVCVCASREMAEQICSILNSRAPE